MKKKIATRSSPPARSGTDGPSYPIAGLSQLLRGLDYASEAGCDPWDFAVEISELRDAGMKMTDIRLLISKGRLQHGKETSKYGDPHRSFLPADGLTFLSRSAFVLTPKGADEVRKLLAVAAPAKLSAPYQGSLSWLLSKGSIAREDGSDEVTEPIAGSRAKFGRHPPPDIRPSWNGRSGELCVGTQLVKKFRVRAKNQELILSAFQEENWPPSIDDPLSPTGEIEPKRRLHDAIKRLNHGQLVQLMRFHGNGNGEGICWELLPQLHGDERAATRDISGAAQSRPRCVKAHPKRKIR